MDNLKANNSSVDEQSLARQVEELQQKIEQLQANLEEEKSRHLRTRADFDNFRKRVERDAEINRTMFRKDIMLDLLKFLEIFDQARKQVQDPAAARGIEIMARQFGELLDKQGVKPIECVGLPYDPEEQEGLGYIATDLCPEGCVAEEICPGYRLGDLLLKPAQVMVAKKPEPQE